jgi:hypothetical protein
VPLPRAATGLSGQKTALRTNRAAHRAEARANGQMSAAIMWGLTRDLGSKDGAFNHPAASTLTKREIGHALAAIGNAFLCMLCFPVGRMRGPLPQI